MPMKNGNAAVAQEGVDAFELVIDQAFQRRDIKHLDGFAISTLDLADDGEEDGFRLSRSGVGGENKVVVRVEDHARRFDLDRAKTFPTVRIDKVLYERRKSVKCLRRVHGLSFL